MVHEIPKPPVNDVELSRLTGVLSKSQIIARDVMVRLIVDLHVQIERYLWEAQNFFGLNIDDLNECINQLVETEVSQMVDRLDRSLGRRK